MSKKNSKNPQETITPKEKRMPKGWVHIGSNELINLKKTYVEESQSTKTWNKLMIDAKKYNDNLSKSVVSFNKHQAIGKNQTADESASQAEELIEKKYKKDKTQIKIPKTQVI